MNKEHVLKGLDDEINRLEKELHRLHEARRELINYYGLNKNDQRTDNKGTTDQTADS